jgi:hypothetical protein
LLGTVGWIVIRSQEKTSASIKKTSWRKISSAEISEIFHKAKFVLASLGPHIDDSTFLCDTMDHMERNIFGKFDGRPEGR